MPLPLAAAAIGAGVVSKGVGMLSSYAQQKKAERDLAKLTSTPRARFGVSPQVRGLYEQALTDATNPRGYGGAALSSYRSRLGQLMANKYRQASSLGGGARGVNAVLAGQEADALGSMYAGDEAMKQSNRNMALVRASQGASAYQRILDANTQQDISYRNLLEQSLGNSIRGQRDYRLGTLSGLGNDLITGGLMYAGGIGGNGTEDVTGDMTQTITSPNSALPPSITDLRLNGNYNYRNNPTMDRLNNPRRYAPAGFGRVSGPIK